QSAHIRLKESFEQLRTQQKSVELATQNYDVVNNRYNNDLALLTDMLDASNTKLSDDVVYNRYNNDLALLTDMLDASNTKLSAELQFVNLQRKAHESYALAMENVEVAVQSAHIRLKESFEQLRTQQKSVELAVQSAHIRLKESFEQLRTQQKSVELATQNYDVVNNRQQIQQRPGATHRHARCQQYKAQRGASVCKPANKHHLQLL
ncbi:hypothetical protein QE152_g41458, partial [Popillia japonica]